jgi:hypothetical protein
MENRDSGSIPPRQSIAAGSRVQILLAHLTPQSGASVKIED